MDTQYVGIDICSSHLDISLNGVASKVAFNEKAVTQFIAKLNKSAKPKHLIFESTGYLSDMLKRWIKGSIAFSCLNPNRVRLFARGCNILAKTDELDAKMLVAYAEKNELRAQKPLSEEQLRLKEGHRTMQLLKRTRAKLKTNLHSLIDENTKSVIAKCISNLDEQIEEIQEYIINEIEKSQELLKLYERFQEIEGIGKNIAAAVVIMVPEIGELTRKEITSLAGLCNYSWSSGKTESQRHYKTGRKAVRSILYMGALVASVHNKVISVYYKDLLKEKKKKKVALIACARKLLIYMNAEASKIKKEVLAT